MFSMDKQYLDDYRIDGRWGITAGISGQYDVNSWLAVRADLNWTQKNYRKHRMVLSQMDFKYQNNYLQLPVMASFSTGGEKLRGFCNLGVYGGYWFNSYLSGSDYNSFGQYLYTFSKKQEFDSDWAAQVEVRYYYSTVSSTKQYMRVNDYRYNSTTAVQLAAYYCF